MKSRQKIDLGLLSKAKNGDQKAFREIFEYYKLNMFFYIYSIVPNVSDAEDLTMITFEKAFSNLDKYAPFYEFKTWLFKIGLNNALDFIRYKKRNPEALNIYELNYIKTEIETPEQILIKKETEQKISIIIGEMPFVYQRLIEYREQEYLARSIAQKLGISINTVVGQLSRTKRILIKKLAS